MRPEQMKEARGLIVFGVALLFTCARLVSKTSAPPKHAFDEAENFVKEAERRKLLAIK